MLIIFMPQFTKNQDIKNNFTCFFFLLKNSDFNQTKKAGQMPGSLI